MSKDSDAFEEEVVDAFGKRGFWVTLIPKAKDGSQPADIIALSHSDMHLIDAKLCASGRFVLSRMEENQVHAMEMFIKKTGGRCWFALKFSENEVYLMPYPVLKQMQENGTKSIKVIPENYRLENMLDETRNWT